MNCGRLWSQSNTWLLLLCDGELTLFFLHSTTQCRLGNLKKKNFFSGSGERKEKVSKKETLTSSKFISQQNHEMRTIGCCCCCLSSLCIADTKAPIKLRWQQGGWGFGPAYISGRCPMESPLRYFFYEIPQDLFRCLLSSLFSPCMYEVAKMAWKKEGDTVLSI